MAVNLFNRIGQLGLGVALVGGVVNSALYNGKINKCDVLESCVKRICFFYLQLMVGTELLFLIDLLV